MKQSFKTKLKQLWVPKVFRLPEPEFTKDQVDLLEDLIQLIHPTLSMAETATKDDRVQMAHFLVDLGTGIWRIRRKIESLGRMPKEIRDALYSLESTWMSMSEGGVEIVDHIGSIPSKNEAKIVEVREIPNLAREQVVDAVKPTILLKGEVIQLGEVVMGRPAKHGAPQAEPQTSEEPAEPGFPVTPPAASGEEEPEQIIDQADHEDEETVTHEVETLSMELPVRAAAPAEETASPAPEEAPETEPVSPAPDEDGQPEDAPGEPVTADEDVPEPEAEEAEAAEPETPLLPDAAPAEEDASEPLDEMPEITEAPEIITETPEIPEMPAPDEAGEPEQELTADASPELPEAEEGFVRDVPTPFEEAIAQEEVEEPKKKRTTRKAGLAKAKQVGIAETDPAAPKPKRRRTTRKSAAEAENDG